MGADWSSNAATDSNWFSWCWRRLVWYRRRWWMNPIQPSQILAFNRRLLLAALLHMQPVEKRTAPNSVSTRREWMPKEGNNFLNFISPFCFFFLSFLSFLLFGLDFHLILLVGCFSLSFNFFFFLAVANFLLCSGPEVLLFLLLLLLLVSFFLSFFLGGLLNCFVVLFWLGCFRIVVFFLSSCCCCVGFSVGLCWRWRAWPDANMTPKRRRWGRGCHSPISSSLLPPPPPPPLRYPRILWRFSGDVVEIP